MAEQKSDFECPICEDNGKLVCSCLMHTDGAMTPLITYRCPRCGGKRG